MTQIKWIGELGSVFDMMPGARFPINEDGTVTVSMQGCEFTRISFEANVLIQAGLAILVEEEPNHSPHRIPDKFIDAELSLDNIMMIPNVNIRRCMRKINQLIDILQFEHEETQA